MILVQERKPVTITKEPPVVGEPYKHTNLPHRFYRRNTNIEYHKGIHNPYIEKLIEL